MPDRAGHDGGGVTDYSGLNWNKTQGILQEIIESDLATKRDLKELELRLIIKLGSIVVVVIGLLVALSKLNVF